MKNLVIVRNNDEKVDGRKRGDKINIRIIRKKGGVKRIDKELRRRI